MSNERSVLTAKEFQHTGDTDDWRVLGRGASAWFDAPTHAAAAALLGTITRLAESTERPVPDCDLRAGGIRVRILPDGRFTDADAALARSISQAAAEAGLHADPAAVQDVQLTFDSMDKSTTMPFWQAALGYEQDGDDLVDPTRRHPPIWFQDQDVPRPLRNRLHIDAVRAQPSAVAALEAVRQQGASSIAEHGFYATVADAEGNEVDLLPLPDGADRWPGPETSDWRLVFAAVACYPTASAAQSVQLAEAAASLADAAGLPLGIDVRPGLVTFDSGKDAWEMDDGYEALAALVQAAARGMGLTADVSSPRFVQVGIDAADIPRLRAFWRAVLGYDEDVREGVTDIVDPRQLNMPFFFQNIDVDDAPRRAQRNRIHVDVFVPDDQAQARLDAAIGAGGRVVYDAEAPEWWTVADPEGNEVDIAVAVGREEIWRAAQASGGDS